MTQQQLQQQQQNGVRLDADGEDTSHRPRGWASPPTAAVWPPPRLVDDLLTLDQQRRVECLNAARDLVLQVADGATRLDVADMITVAEYMITGTDPFCARKTLP